MKNIKIALLLVIPFAQNVVFAGGNKDKLMQMNAVQYLNAQVRLVAPSAQVRVSDEEFDNFIAKMKRKDDNEIILREYFAARRNGDVLYTQCRLPVEGEITKPEISLRELLETINDVEIKKSVIKKVVRHSMEREAMIIRTPRGTNGEPAYNFQVLDNTQQMVECILKFSKK